MMFKALFLAFLVTVTLVPAALTAEGDIIWDRKTEQGGVPPAVFSHWLHRVRFKCYVCHDSIFQMEKGANKISMSEIMGGKFCGQCHDGKTAFNVSFDTCNRCHAQK